MDEILAHPRIGIEGRHCHGDTNCACGNPNTTLKEFAKAGAFQPFEGGGGKRRDDGIAIFRPVERMKVAIGRCCRLSRRRSLVFSSHDEEGNSGESQTDRP